MSPDCRQVAEGTTLSLEVVEEDQKSFVEAEFVNDSGMPLWVAQEAVPAYRVDPRIGALQLSYGYFDDLYGGFRGRYMIPPMKQVATGDKLRWRIRDSALLKKMLVPGTAVQVRLRMALKEFPQSSVRGDQPLDAYVEASCPVQYPPTVLLEPDPHS